MKLYLSSYNWGDHPEQLLELMGDRPKRAGLITNAADQFPEDGIAERTENDRQYLGKMGIEAERLDLRGYFSGQRTAELRERMSGYGLIWVRGANVFVLRRALAQSGADSILVDLLSEDKIVYGGYSAGACVMGTTLRGLELVDDAYVAPEGYLPEVIWEGLGLVPYAIAPHYRSDHPESPLIEKSVAYYEANGVPFRALRDGEVIIVDQ